MTRKRNPNDLTDGHWNEIKSYEPCSKEGGRSEKHPRREIVNALPYLARKGIIPKRTVPHDFPPWQTVYHYFPQREMTESLKQIHDHLTRPLWLNDGRHVKPSAATIKSQLPRTGVKKESTLELKSTYADGTS